MKILIILLMLTSTFTATAGEFEDEKSGTRFTIGDVDTPQYPIAFIDATLPTSIIFSGNGDCNLKFDFLPNPPKVTSNCKIEEGSQAFLDFINDYLKQYNYVKVKR